MKEMFINFFKQKKIKRSQGAFYLFALILVFSTPVFAAEPTFVSSAKTLLSDALTWVLVLVPVAGGLMIGWHAFMKTLADNDPAVVADRNKKMKQVLIGVGIAVSASAIVKVITDYF